MTGSGGGGGGGAAPGTGGAAWAGGTGGAGATPGTGATPFGYRVAEQFGIPIAKLRPGLVPLSVAPDDWKPYADLTGVSLDVVVGFGKHSFRENMLITHRGLSGPAILQISSYWQHGQPLHIDLLPECDMAALLDEQKGPFAPAVARIGTVAVRWREVVARTVDRVHAVQRGAARQDETR